MARIVLRPACPVCGQTLRANDWVNTVGIRPLAVAHELSYGRQTIERRDLAIGESASPDAVVVIAINAATGNPVFAPADKRKAPDGWIEQLNCSIIRAAKALGLKVEVEQQSTVDLDDSSLTKNEFNEKSLSYVDDAKRIVKEAQAELELRQNEVQAAARRRGIK